MNRRGLLPGILAAGFAPAAIASGVLMPVRKIVAPDAMERLLDLARNPSFGLDLRKFEAAFSGRLFEDTKFRPGWPQDERRRYQALLDAAVRRRVPA